VLLARLDTAALDAALDCVPRASLTAATRVDRGAVADAVMAARETGFAVVEDEFAVGGTGVAAVIPLGPGQPLAALGLAVFHSATDRTHRAFRRICRPTPFPALQRQWQDRAM
jgi:DNA-binding IclR family transcriptional regulator